MPDYSIGNKKYYELLFGKYKSKGVIIDSNLLIYYFIGSYNFNLVKSYKRTRRYGENGYKIIYNVVKLFDRIITSPHILAEISNLSNNINDNETQRYYDLFLKKTTTFDEIFFPATEITENDNIIKKFGLTDSMILRIAQNKSHLVLTDDLDFSAYLLLQKIDVINFNHLLTYYIKNSI